MSTSSNNSLCLAPRTTSIRRSRPSRGIAEAVDAPTLIPRRRCKAREITTDQMDKLPGLKRLREAEAEAVARQQGKAMLNILRAAGNEAVVRRRLAKRARLEKQELEGVDRA